MDLCVRVHAYPYFLFLQSRWHETLFAFLGFGVGGSELMVKFYYIVRFFSVCPHVFT